MISSVTAETFKNLVFDAGMLLTEFDFSSATDAESLLALATSQEAQAKSWRGATKGGVNIQENREYWSPEMDGLRMSYKGAKRFAKAEPKMTGTLVEYTPMNVKIVSGSAVISGEGTKVVKVQPIADIEPGSYMSNVVFIGDCGDDGLYLAEMRTVVCTSGINGQTADKNIGTLPFEFAAHQDSPLYTKELPISYYFFRSSGTASEEQTATASEEQVTTAEGEEE